MPADAAVEVVTPDVTEVRPLERRIDTVLRIKPPGGDGFLLAVEAQERKDRAKGSSWAYYAAYLQAKYDQPALLLVVCQDRRTADWAAGPFRFGPAGWITFSMHPLVLGPDNVPVIKDADEASRDLAMAFFSALTHGRDPDAPAILEAVACALKETADPLSVEYYSEMLDMGLGDTPARKAWRDLMGVGILFPGRGTLLEEKYLEGKTEGKAEERAQMILRVLRSRNVPTSTAIEERITTCTDLDVLSRWLDRAFAAANTADLFAEEE